jgi:hypothetical protein
MSAYYYYQVVGGEESWRPIPVSQAGKVLEDECPMFVTALSVSKLVEDMTYEDKLNLAYEGPLYFDWDSADEVLVIEKVNQFLDKLEALRVDLSMCRLYASGGKGYHLEVPQELFLEKLPKNGIKGLPSIYREIALELCVDTLDLKIYSAGRGRMWRRPNVQRPNGRYKVPLSLVDMRNMTADVCHIMTSAPRALIVPKPPELCIDLSILYSRAAQKVDDLMKRRAKFKPDPKMREKAQGASVQWMMSGLGIRADVGFQEIATQLAIAAVAGDMNEELFISECAGLISSHQSDGKRYNTENKRAEELRRMHRYMHGNLCYEFSVGAIKRLLTHSAPDLDGLPVTKEEVKEVIEEAALEEEVDVDEYNDVARGVSLARHGVYLDTPEGGKKRICAVSFANSSILRSSDTCQIIGYETDVLVNGQTLGRQVLETDVFAGLLPFNRFAAKYGHAFQGTDAQVRTVMMRFVEQAKKKGTVQYVVKREGLDVVSIPHHENPDFRVPFLVWADSNGVITEPRIERQGLNLAFAGFPDPRGVFKTDIADAPALVEWLEHPGHSEQMASMLQNLMTCQKPDFLGKVIGWHIACFYKQIFFKAYGKFPLLHVNGAAGLGKSETVITLQHLYFYNREARTLSPASTAFAIQTHMTASATIPTVLDEYKPHEMNRDLHNKLKLMFRDSYNQRPISRGGGSRESDDFRVLHETELTSPLVFIAEAAEDEAAVMERVVLATITRPTPTLGLKWLARYQAYHGQKQLLAIIGQYLAASIVHTESVESIKAEFDALYARARRKYMLNEEDLKGDLDSDVLHNKQNAKERSVYNHTIAKFGMMRLRALVNEALGPDLDSLMGELEDGIFDRMSDLHASTTPEYVKVLSTMSTMSHHVDADRPEALREGFEYGFSTLGSKDCIEIAMRAAYLRYRTYCRNASTNPLYASEHAFTHALKDSPAFIKLGNGEALLVPGVSYFDVAELARLGVDIFKSKSSK